jgi:hypothetical protein
LRFTRAALFNTQGTNRRLTPKRVGRLLLVYTVYPLLELVTWCGLWLDDLLYPGYRRQEVRQPVFVLGNPRSGTTFLHRLLARDEGTFSWMQTWEILLAPSITMRKVLRAIIAIDRRLGGPLNRWLAAQERGWQEQNVMHSIALREPEEDENLLLHIWSLLAIWTWTALLDEARPYTYYDTEVSQAENAHMMTFYRRCLQRHLYAGESDAGRARDTRAQVYLSKSPSFSPRIDAFLETFPDARFIYLVRNPLDAIPSFVSITKYIWNLFCDPVEYDSLARYALDMTRHWYRYPLERLGRLPRDRYAIVKFDDLVADPERTVTGIYRRLGIELSPEYARLLHNQAVRERRYRSRHKYSLEELGLNREQIVAEFEDVFERFGFDTRHPSVQTEN